MSPRLETFPPPPSDRQILVLRGVTLVFSILVALASGSNYAVANWAGALAHKLNLSATQINLVSTAGNLGVYISGPLWGLIVDARGPRLNLASAAVLLLGGYLGIRAYYDGTLEYTGGSSLAALCFFSFCTGSGSSAGLAGAMNSSAKSFPDSTRATATGLVLAGFGLSAFMFSTISRVFFPGNTSSFLLLLAVGCFLPMVLGVFLVKPVLVIPQGAHKTDYAARESGWARPPPGVDYTALREDEEGSEDEDEGLHAEIRVTPASPGSLEPRRQTSALELSPTRSVRTLDEDAEGDPLTKTVSRQSHVSLAIHEVNISGRQLASNVDFWILFAFVGLISGTGLMWINNVGLSTLALFSEGNPKYDHAEAAKLQAAQVSLISLWNCAGRVLIGLTTDLAKHRYAIRRVHFLLVVAAIMALSQVIGIFTTSVDGVWAISSTMGLAYGGLFGLAPVVALEWFGLANFSLNWGFVSMSPIIGGNGANIIYGRIYDAHTVGRIGKAARALIARVPITDPNDSSHECYLGQACYLPAFHLTLAACILALALALLASWRRERQSKERRRALLATRWEGDREEGWGEAR